MICWRGPVRGCMAVTACSVENSMYYIPKFSLKIFVLIQVVYE